ncbi:MAG TPA: hypothetical protein VHY31_05095 [Streptosporangiaceae bacterium]|nr:hypothetical protein [Streptosporangiaceae bacterium]
MCARQAGVVTSAAAFRNLGEPAVRWRLSSGRWRRVCYGVIVTQSGPLTEEQRLWVALLAAGDGAALAGLTAARLDGLTGFDDRRVHLLIPVSRKLRKPLRDVVVHRCARLGPADVHPARQPPRTRLARSLVDGATWVTPDRLARAILAAGVQQRLVRATDLGQALAYCPHGPRRRLLRATLGDVSDGAEALSELDFSDLVGRYGLPEPDRQARRVDAQGNRWLDAVWEWARLVAEIDGRWHGCRGLVGGPAARQRADPRRVPGTTFSCVRGAGQPGSRGPATGRGAAPGGLGRAGPGIGWRPAGSSGALNPARQRSGVRNGKSLSYRN